MGSDSDPPKNPFVRWKQHVDTHVAATLNNLLGIPSIVTKNLNLRSFDDAAGPSASGHHRDATDALPTELSSAAAQTGPPAAPAAGGPPADASSYPPSSSSDDNSGLDDVDANQLLAWHKFAYYSAYSPNRLQQQQHIYGLPPPFPNDVPFGADPYGFTYADAFEDLLRASSGRPLMDLGIRSYQNKQHQMRHGTSVEPPYVFFHRLHTQRLLDAYFPRTPLAASASALKDRSGAGRPEALTADTPNDKGIHAAVEEALAQRTEDIWGTRGVEAESREMERYRTTDEGSSCSTSKDGGSASQYPAPRSPESGQGGLFNELDRVFRVLGQIIDEDMGGAKSADSKGGEEGHGRLQPLLNLEDELYQLVLSKYEADKSLSTLIKTVAGDMQQASSASSEANTNIPTVTTRSAGVDDQGYETIQTTDEQIDMFGNRHVQMVVRRLDAAGNEVARETRYTILPTTEPAKRGVSGETERTESSNTKEEEGRPGQSDRTKSGWFWK